MLIICGTDLSEASAGALDVARALATQRGDDEVVLVHVVEPGGPAARDQALDQARAGLAAQAHSRAGAPMVRTKLIVGPAGESLVGYAETEHSDLIVIAARSTGGSLFRLGSTAARVIARATVPVIVVRDPAPWLAFASADHGGSSPTPTGGTLDVGRLRSSGGGPESSDPSPASRPLRVLLGIDDSATCDLGIQWLQGMRARGPIDVVLGAIYYPDDAAMHYGLDPRALVDRDPEIERLMERDLLRRFGGSTKNVVARPRRGLGRIGDHVIELAREEKVDAIVVGTSQKTGLDRLGSVSSVIVNDAPQSVICVPPQAVIATATVPTLRGALVATDLSSFANRAVAYAFALIPADGEVHIVHVLKDDAEADEIELTKQLYALAPVGAAQKVTAHIVRGDEAAISLAQCAARLGVDVICISSHGRSGIARALVGSVADRLLRATRLPVLVLRPA